MGAPRDGGGAAFVYSGMTGAPVASFGSATSSVRFGAALARSGVAGLVVGAPGANEVHLISGTGTATVMAGPLGAGAFGHAVASVPDMDGDGVDEILVGDPGASGGAVPSTFDFMVSSGETRVRDTDGDPVLPAVHHGVLVCRDFTIQSGGRLVVTGDATLTVLAWGSVVIDGELSADGTDADDVNTINNAGVPELGAAGLQ